VSGFTLAEKLEDFATKWATYHGTEQAGGQSFLYELLDLYEVHPPPGKLFEQHPVRVRKVRTSQGSLFGAVEEVQSTAERMDMYIPKVCIWEMKSPGEKDLEKHHDQILMYWARMRTRYMVLCNFHEFWIYDTDQEGGQLSPVIQFPLKDLPANAEALFFLKGEESHFARRAERVTQQMASEIGGLVRRRLEKLQETDRQRERERVARFVLECVFAMFAEDAELIPRKMFSRVLEEASRLGHLGPVYALFEDFARSEPHGKTHKFAPYVNGTLFDRTHAKLQMSQEEIDGLLRAAVKFDWQDVRPEIFGSIFEQALDPSLRHELGAHFTREDDILRIIVPTVIEPWRERIRTVRGTKEVTRLIEQMKAFHILDPACGCGNFLYVAYREMKRMEAELRAAWTRASRAVARTKRDITAPPPGPYFTLSQMHGLEINPFAANLARVVLWIGEYLAMRELGLDEETLPLKNLNKNVIEGDALFADWVRPEGELAIIGNPPYLGVRKMRAELGDDYVEKVFAEFPDNRAADFVTNWYAKALKTLRKGERAGFVSTNSITQNESREASIDRVVGAGGTIIDAWKSYPWQGEAAVHVSLVNWVMDAYDGLKILDGREVSAITPGLTDGVDVTVSKTIRGNQGLSFMGVTPGNAEFVLDDEQKKEIVEADPKSAEVIKPYLIGRDVNREADSAPSRWIIDFGMMEREEAENFKGAFRYVQRHVYPSRKENKRESYAKYWWRFVEPRSGMRNAISELKRVIVIAAVSKHVMPILASTKFVLDHQLFVFALPEWYHLGLLQSQPHGLWAKARGSTLKGDLRYTGTTIFETFPFPLLPKGKYDPRKVPNTDDARQVASASEAFDGLRRRLCRERELGLTKIHNLLAEGELPELQKLSDELNDAVTACYGWPKDTWRDENETLKRLLALNRKVADE
jgi:hypothetical protein